MKTFRLIGMALLALCVTFTSCSNDEEEDSNTTIAQLKGIWFNGENENYPYFIIEDGYCYFQKTLLLLLETTERNTNIRLILKQTL